MHHRALATTVEVEILLQEAAEKDSAKDDRVFKPPITSDLSRSLLPISLFLSLYQ